MLGKDPAGKPLGDHSSQGKPQELSEFTTFRICNTDRLAGGCYTAPAMRRLRASLLTRPLSSSALPAVSSSSAFFREAACRHISSSFADACTLKRNCRCYASYTSWNAPLASAHSYLHVGGPSAHLSLAVAATILFVSFDNSDSKEKREEIKSS